jgi:hypothetical protein
VEDVTEQFLHIFKWYCAAADLTMDEFIGHLAKRIPEPDQWKKIRFAMQIDDPVQLDAEDALVALVKSIPERSRTIRRWSAEPGRNVDWAQTWLAAKTTRPGEFCSLIQTPTLDLQLLHALAGLAYRWRRILEVVPFATGKERRISQLRDVEAVLPRRQTPWSLAIARRLKRIDGAAASTIESAMQMWEGAGNRGEALSNQFNKWLKTDRVRDLKALNEDTLFEWTVALAIARTAVKKEMWSMIPTRLTGKEAKYGDVMLKRGDWRLRIAKGKPLDSVGNVLNAQGEDIVTLAQKQAGLNPTGFQPDVVLSFFKENEPESLVTFLADAKRNGEGDGRGYISASIQKAAVYVYVFQKWLHHQPYCTLFFWQGVQKVISLPAGTAVELKTLASVISSNISEKYLPEILCFDSRMMAESSDILAAWLSQLAKLSGATDPNIGPSSAPACFPQP